MEPWEQHWAVINMPRFAYATSSADLNRAGFLITCTFRREKSATKEALSLLSQYLEPIDRNRESLGEAKANISIISYSRAEDDKPGPEIDGLGLDPGRLGMPTVFTDLDAHSFPNKDSDGQEGETEGAKESPKIISGSLKAAGVMKECKDRNVCLQSGVERSPIGIERKMEEGDTADIYQRSSKDKVDLSLLKVAAMGIVYISLSGQFSGLVVSIVSQILNDIHSGALARPQWCHRILPIQATCSCEVEELQVVVRQLLKEHFQQESVETSGEPLKFAVAFNMRGTDANVSSKTGSTEVSAIGRDRCIDVVAQTVQKFIPDVKVDLTSPQLVVVVEVLPMGGAQSKMFCAVSILPGDLFICKPRLCIKPLTGESKSKKRKQYHS